MEPLRQLEFDAMSGEPQPDGYIEVFFHSPNSHQRFYFSNMQDWNWRQSDPGVGDVLVVRIDSGERYEFPSIGIRHVKVVGNGTKYCAWKNMEEAAQHVLELEHHLEKAHEKFDEKRRRYFDQWPASQ